MQNSSGGGRARVVLPGARQFDKERAHDWARFWYWRGGGLIYRVTAPTRAALDAATRTEADKIAAAYVASRQPAAGRGRFAGLVADYRRSTEWAAVAASTKRNWLTHLDGLIEAFGMTTLAQMDARGFRAQVIAHRDALADTPRKADMRMQVLSRVCAWAVDREHLTRNPAARVGKLYVARRAALVWLPEEIDAACAATSPSVARAMRFMALTAFRPGDIATLTWREVEASAGRITKAAAKGRRSGLTYTAPLTPEVSALLAETPRHAVQVFTTEKRRPWASSASLCSAMRKARVDGGVRDVLNPYDLRGAAITHWLASGFSLSAIALMAAWSEQHVEKIVRHYVDAGVLTDAIVDRRRKS